MANIKLIAVDIGGSLIDDDNKIPIKNIESLKKMKELGIKISLITARMFSSTKYISYSIDADYGVFGNGNSVVSLNNKEIFYSSFIPSSDVIKLIMFAKSNKLYIHLSSNFYEGSDEMNYFLLKHNILNQNYPNNLKSNIVMFDDIFDYQTKIDNIINVIFVSEKNMDKIYKMLKKEFPYLSITEYNKNLYEKAINKTISYIEVGKSCSTKATGLKILIDKLGINKDEVLVIGDGINDVEMFEQFPNSGCLGNGDVRVQEKASYISKCTNNEAGVSEIIEHFIKRRSL